MKNLIILVIIGAGGLWFLNNTVAGFQIKCQILGDLGACLVLALR